MRTAPVERRTRSFWPSTQARAVTMAWGCSATTPAQPVVSTPTLAARSASRTQRSPAGAGAAAAIHAPRRNSIVAPSTPAGAPLFGLGQRDDVVEAREVHPADAAAE